MSKAIISFDSENLENLNVRIEENGVCTVKSILLDTFLRAVTTSTVRREEKVRYNLPQNTVSVATDGENTELIFFISKQVRPAIHNENTYLIPYPPLLICISRNEYKEEINRVFIFAIKDSFEEDRDLYFFPFSNVSNDGSVCFGSNKLPYVEDIKDNVKMVLDLFFSAPYNGDYYKMDRTSYLMSFEKLLENLNGKKNSIKTN